MRAILVWIQIICKGLERWLGRILGGYDGSVYMLFVFVLVNYITGIIYAAINKNLSRKECLEGIIKKVLIFVMVSIGHLIDSEFIGSRNTVRTAVILFYISIEGISMLDNVKKLGLPIPKIICDILTQLHNKSGKSS